MLLQITGTNRGDFNGDGLINNSDYLILRDNLQEAHTYEFEGELTGDYFVDLDDFREFKTIFAAQGVGSLDGLTVPEPASFVLLAAAAVPLAHRSSAENESVIALAHRHAGGAAGRRLSIGARECGAADV